MKIYKDVDNYADSLADFREHWKSLRDDHLTEHPGQMREEIWHLDSLMEWLLGQLETARGEE